MDRRCPNCGEALPSEQNSCGECGYEVIDNTRERPDVARPWRFALVGALAGGVVVAGAAVGWFVLADDDASSDNANVAMACDVVEHLAEVRMADEDFMEIERPGIHEATAAGMLLLAASYEDESFEWARDLGTDLARSASTLDEEALEDAVNTIRNRCEG